MNTLTKHVMKPLLLCLFIAILSGCDDDNSSNPKTTEGKPSIVISTFVGNSSYLGTLKDLSVGSMTNEASYEHTARAAVFVYEDMVFVSEHNFGDNIHKYNRTNSNLLEKAGKLVVPAGGAAFSMYFKDATKAYISLMNNGKVLVINPTTLDVTDTIDLNSYAVEGALVAPSDMVLRNDGKLFVCLSQRETQFICYDSAYVAVIDAEADTVEKVIFDERLTGIGGFYNGNVIVDEKNDIYFYGGGNYGFDEDANEGFLRIKSGETEFDPGYYFNPRNTTVTGFGPYSVSYSFHLCYAGNGKAYSIMDVPELTSNPPDYINDKNAQLIEIDLYNTTLKKIDLPAGVGLNTTAIDKLDDKIVLGLSTRNGDGVYTYDLTTKQATQSPVITTVGPPNYLIVFED